MKRSKRVTEGNLPTILSYVKKLVRNKHQIIFTELKVKTLKKANHRVNCRTTLFKGFKLGNEVIIIKSTIHFPKPFIAVHTEDGSLAVIDIGDQVHVTANQVIVKKGLYGEHSSAIEVWKFA